jgi:hypothetical protein
MNRLLPISFPHALSPAAHPGPVSGCSSLSCLRLLILVLSPAAHPGPVSGCSSWSCLRLLFLVLSLFVLSPTFVLVSLSLAALSSVLLVIVALCLVAQCPACFSLMSCLWLPSVQPAFLYCPVSGCPVSSLLFLVALSLAAQFPYCFSFFALSMATLPSLLYLLPCPFCLCLFPCLWLTSPVFLCSFPCLWLPCPACLSSLPVSGCPGQCPAGL